ncbi:NAD-dependent succinate-semialdehyde dehydrogenase [Citricoccus sp. SGAir0253]|uniref:NAD-dependent succinate-semialdehyde dehydrogenase n=1 Tax=Citricoccus sp. SGAir0253 TaxID=2567881 RepID=UPI0010CD2958|nr:NAD-dependent succinate-semialdehyde dehydrogenase [Citricoccus sp. SGAir0253]QCU78427.1 NAD-dependent succinate-semialdehyde dehydrogenase [Citricoccus sp. SGAir0253]
MTAPSTAALGYRTQNPATGEVLREYPHATDEQVEAALAASAAAFADWSARPMAERGEIVRHAGELFFERRRDLAQIATREMGKPVREAGGEAKFCGQIFSYYAVEGPELAADQLIKDITGQRAVIQRRPIGPLLGIMPWNYPFYQVARFAAPNLMLGNTILLKHAEICPGSALALQQLMDDAGVPAGVYQNLFATHGQVSTIIADDRVQGVSLTGSERAGAAVAEQAGRHLKKVVLELGGSDPYIVLSAADPRAAAREAFATRMENAGQACTSNKRMIVMDDVYDEFVAELAERARALAPGDPAQPGEDTYPPLSSEAAATALVEQIEDAVAHGATLHAGGRRVDGPGYYVEPAVLTGVTPEARAYREELFGPAAVVYRVSSDEEAVRLANDSPYGLGGAVFATEPGRAERVAERLQVGMTHANAPSAEGADMPFGGVKRSGYGRELGPLGMDEFVNKRLYYVRDGH